MRKSMLIAAAFVMLAVPAFAQDAPAVKKSLTAYADGGTGNLNKDAGAVLDSWGEFGVTYSQNFANAQWLSVNTTIAICTGTGGMLFDHNGKSIGVDKATKFSGYGAVGLNMTPYFTMKFQSSGRLDFEGRYKKVFAEKHSLSTAFYIDVFPTGNSLYSTVSHLPYFGHDGTVADKTKIEGVKNLVGLIQLTVAYGYKINPEWTIGTDLRFRFHGAAVNGHRSDSPQAFRDNFNIRWNTAVYYSNANGFGAYATLRYQPSKFYTTVKHDVYVNTGISYSYNLSAL